VARAVRADKTCLAGITATLIHYLKDEALREIPVWKMISMPPEEVKARAESWMHELGTGVVNENQATVGGGSLPGESMPSFVLEIRMKSPINFSKNCANRIPHYCPDR